MIYFLRYTSIVLGMLICTMCNAQNSQEFAGQLRKIVASASSNFVSLKKGTGKNLKEGILFDSRLETQGTDKSNVLISHERDGNNIYIISINSASTKGDAQKLTSLWDSNIKTALGSTINRDCHVVDLDRTYSADQCDFKVFRKEYSAIVSLIQRPNRDDKTYVVEIRVWKE